MRLISWWNDPSRQQTSSNQTTARKHKLQPLTQAVLLAGVTAMSLSVNAAPSDKKSFDHTIFALEHALIGAGYELKRVDGVMDPVTEKALHAYQEANPAVPVTDKVDDPTLRALGIKKANRVAAKPTQMASGKSVPVESEDDAKSAPTKTEEPRKKEEDSGWSFF